MKIEDNKIVDISKEDKQMLYDALCQYMFQEAKIGRSEHFAADIHEKESVKASRCVMMMRGTWLDIIH